MPNKKNKASKKPARPAGGPAAKKNKKAAGKPAAKKAALKKPASKKPAPKKAALKKAAKPAAKSTAPKQPKPAAKKTIDTKSLVSVKPSIKPIVKKEPPKPVKVVIPKTTTKSVKKYEPEFTRSVLDAAAIDPSLPTQRYSDTDLAEFRELIQRKLDTAKKELTYLQGLITRKDESGDMDEGRYMTMEDGSVSMEREQLSQMASRQITFIDHLEKAMMRIENKTYGICRVTGKLIDKARLRAVPHATLSIEAKQMMSK
jgi:RNA polymerase-binding transcription factor DksA